MGSHRIALERRNAGMGLLIPCRRSRIMPCVLSSGHVSRPDVTGWAHHRSIGGRHGPYHTIKPTQPPRRATWQSHRGQITGRTAPEAPVSTRHATRQSHHSQIPPRPTTTAMKKPSACAEKSLSVGRRLSITGNHGIWRPTQQSSVARHATHPIRRATRPCQRPSQPRHRRRAGPHWPRIRR